MKSGALKIVLLYIVAGLLWVSLSDKLLHAAQGSMALSLLLLLGSVKGYVSVFLTGFLLYQLIRLHHRRISASERQYRSYFEDNPSPMWIYNRVTLRFVAVNDAAIAHYGFSRQEFSQMTILDIRPPGNAEKVWSAIKNLQNTYKDSGVWLHRKKDGTLIEVQITSHLITSRREESVMVMAKDITEVKRLEEQRNDYLGKLEDTLNSISDAFFTIDRSWQISTVNAMYETISGFRREDIMGRNFLELWPQTRDSAFFRNFNKAMKERVTVRFEEYSPVLQKWLRMACYPTKEGIAVYFSDITESKEKDLLLGQALERYDMAARATQDMLYEFDFIGNKVSYSQSYGYFAHIDMTREKDPSTAWLGLVHPEDVQKLTEAMNKTLANGRGKYECEYRVNCGLQHYRYVCDQANIIYNESRQPQRMIGAVRDISELKEKEASLLQQNNTLRDIAWVGSHEVRRPLASILGLVELFRASSREDEKEQCFHYLGVSARELDAMICKISKRIDEVIDK